jgi:hypothetical protein
MLSWKEYPRTIGGLGKYLTWFRNFRRPKDLLNMSKHQDDVPEVTLFGSDYDKTNKLVSTGIEQGSLGDNYLLTVLAALADRDDVIPGLFK